MLGDQPPKKGAWASVSGVQPAARHRTSLLTQKDVQDSQRHKQGTLFNVFEAKGTLFLFQKTSTFILAKGREGRGVWLLKKPGSAKEFRISSCGLWKAVAGLLFLI